MCTQELEHVIDPSNEAAQLTNLWHCRSGYLTLSYVAEVVENYTLAEIPLETVVIDTEAWSNIEIFTLSEGYPLPAFQNFVNRLHSRGQRWVRTAVTLYLASLDQCTHLVFTSALNMTCIPALQQSQINAIPTWLSI